MNNNNLEYYKLDFHDKRMKLISEASWDETSFDIGGIIGNATGIIKSLGSAGIDITKLTAYFSKNVMKNALKKFAPDLVEEYRKFKESIQNEIELNKSKSKFWVGLFNDMSQDSKEVFTSLERNIEKLDRRSQQMFREAGLNESQTLALLFSTNPAIVLADMVKLKRNTDPKNKNADKTIDSTEKAVINSLIDTFSNQNNFNDIINKCRNKIQFESNEINAKYIITNKLQRLAKIWINDTIGQNSTAIFFKISSGSIQENTKSLQSFAKDNKPDESLKKLKEILTKSNSKTNENKNTVKLVLSDKNIILTEITKKGIKTKSKSVLFNTIAWLIIDSAKNKNTIAKQIYEEIVNYINEYPSDEETLSDTETEFDSEGSSEKEKSEDETLLSQEQAEKLNKVFKDSKENFQNKIVTKNMDLLAKCEILAQMYIIFSSFLNYKENSNVDKFVQEINSKTTNFATQKITADFTKSIKGKSYDDVTQVVKILYANFVKMRDDLGEIENSLINNKYFTSQYKELVKIIQEAAKFDYKKLEILFKKDK